MRFTQCICYTSSFCVGQFFKTTSTDEFQVPTHRLLRQNINAWWLIFQRNNVLRRNIKSLMSAPDRWASTFSGVFRSGEGGIVASRNRFWLISYDSGLFSIGTRHPPLFSPHNKLANFPLCQTFLSKVSWIIEAWKQTFLYSHHNVAFKFDSFFF